MSVSAEQAVPLASRQFDLERQQRTNPNARESVPSENADRTVKSVESAKDEKGEELFHVVNYASKDGKKEAGFVIVSADRRAVPVLAYGKKGNFELKNLPKGPDIWVDIVTRAIKQGKAELAKPAPEVEALWRKQEGIVAQRIEPGNGCPEDTYYNSGQLMNTEWGQQLTFNMFSPFRSGCSCGLASAGCGAVAIAQVWNYYQRPAFGDINGIGMNYTFPMMQTRLSLACNPTEFGTTPPQPQLQVAHLIRLAGIAASSEYNWPSCNTLTWRGKIKDAFQFAGFSNRGQRVSFSSNQQWVKNELLSGHPVIMDGTTGFANFNDWHIWVIDGARGSFIHLPIDPNDPSAGCYGWGFAYYHLNWGWEGDDDAWYGISGFVGDGETYNTHLNVTIGMRQ